MAQALTVSDRPRRRGRAIPGLPALAGHPPNASGGSQIEQQRPVIRPNGDRRPGKHLVAAVDGDPQGALGDEEPGEELAPLLELAAVSAASKPRRRASGVVPLA